MFDLTRIGEEVCVSLRVLVIKVSIFLSRKLGARVAEEAAP